MKKIIGQFLQEFYHHVFQGFKLYYRRHGAVLASSATFYGILSSIPFLMILTALIGMTINNNDQASSQVIIFIKENFPEISPWIMEKLNAIVQFNLRKDQTLSFFNLFMLLIFSLGFFQSLMTSIEILKDEPQKFKALSKLKAFLGLIITMMFIFILSFFIPVLTNLIYLIHHNPFFDQLVEAAPVLKFFIYYSQTVSIKIILLAKSNIVHGSIFFLYFVFLYHWLFSYSLSYRNCFWGALIFSTLIIIGKFAFFQYLKIFKSTVASSYGDFYALLVIVIWIYYVLSAFFYGACVTLVSHRAGDKSFQNKS